MDTDLRLQEPLLKKNVIFSREINLLVPGAPAFLRQAIKIKS